MSGRSRVVYGPDGPVTWAMPGYYDEQIEAAADHCLDREVYWGRRSYTHIRRGEYLKAGVALAVSENYRHRYIDYFCAGDA